MSGFKISRSAGGGKCFRRDDGRVFARYDATGRLLEHELGPEFVGEFNRELLRREWAEAVE